MAAIYCVLIAVALPPNDVVSWVGTGLGAAGMFVAARAYTCLLISFGIVINGKRLHYNEHVNNRHDDRVDMPDVDRIQ